MILTILLCNSTDVHPSLSGHVIERGNRGAPVGLMQTLLPLAFTVCLTILRAVGTQLMVQVSPGAAKTIGKGKAQTHIVIIRLGNVGIAGYQLTGDRRGQRQLLRWGERLARRRLLAYGITLDVVLLVQPSQRVESAWG